LAAAEEKAKGGNPQPAARPNTVKYGIKHVTALVEQKKPALVLIAHDVDPLEIVIWLPALCRKLGVPYAIVKGKARLGQVVGKKTATALAIVNVSKEDKPNLTKIIEAVNQIPNADQIRRTWGGGLLGVKSQARKNKKEKAIAQETMPGLA